MGGLVESTTYRVETVYDVTDKASEALDKIGRHADGAHASTSKLSTVLMGLGAAALGGGGLMAAKHAFIDFNATVESSKIGLSTMFEANLGGSWEKAQHNAEGVYNEFQKFSTLTPVTTQQIMEFGQGMAVATFQAGGSMKQFTNLTEQGVIAAKAFGAEAGYASMELSHMLAGNINARMMFAKQLLGTMHMDEKEFKNLSAGDRLKAIEKALNSDAMKNAAKAFGDSFTGVTSTFEDKVQILLGRVGKPLFELVTKEIARWNDWLEKNKYTVDKIAESVQNGLVKGFNFVKDAVSWVIDHRDTLIKIAEAFAALKLGGMLGGGLGGSFGGLVGAGAGGTGFGQAAGGALGLGLALGHLWDESEHLSDSFSRTRTINGQVYDISDKTTRKYAELVDTLNALDEATKRATAAMDAEAGAKGTTAAAQLEGVRSMYAEQANVIKDFQEGRISRKEFIEKAQETGIENVDKFAGVDSRVANFMGRGTAAGVSNALAAQARAAEIERLSAQEKTLGSRETTATIATDKITREFLSELTPKQQEQIGVTKDGLLEAKKMNALMQVAVYSLAKQGLVDKTKIRDLLKEMAAAGPDPDAYNNQARANVTNVNIAKVEVPAKDPDRWIMSIDAYAKGLRQAPRGAKQQFPGGQ